MTNTVFVRDMPDRPGHKGVLVNVVTVPESGPNGINIVIIGIIAVGDTWETLPIGNTVLLKETELADSADVLAERYPQKEVPRRTMLVPVVAPPGLG